MAKLLFLAFGIWLVISILRRYQASVTSHEKKPVNEDMVKCKKCGVYLPKSESIQVNQEYYCCNEHSHE